jgi:GT2 family glycosyltransferase
MDYHYMKLLSHTKHPVAPGWCILTDRQIFENNNGFNEKIYFGEDYDYVSRVGLHGFGFVDDIRYYIDLRRVHEEGLRFLYKCVANEVYRHTHGYDLEKSPYCYKFGDHK